MHFQRDCRKYFLDGKCIHYGLWNFQAGSTKLERFLPKNQFQRKLLDFENWINGEVSKIRPHFRKESDLKIDVIKKCAPKLI